MPKISTRQRVAAMTAIPAMAAVAVLLATGFTPPDASRRVQAIGSLVGLDPPLRRTFIPTGDNRPIPAPGPFDWLTSHYETGQTFEEFRSAHPLELPAQRRTIYLQPVGDLLLSGGPPLGRLKGFAESYFGLPVKVLPALDPVALKIRERPHSKQRQLLVHDIIRAAERVMPSDAACLLAITMEDLYPDEAWSFVFGYAMPSWRVGVFGFARYDPRWYGKPADRTLLLRRSCQILAHEASHLLGIDHCVWFDCVVNGINNLDEQDARPLELCPVDLRKLHHLVRFDPAVRLGRLLELCRTLSFVGDAELYARRLAFVTGSEIVTYP